MSSFRWLTAKVTVPVWAFGLSGVVAAASVQIAELLSAYVWVKILD